MDTKLTEMKQEDSQSEASQSPFVGPLERHDHRRGHGRYAKVQATDKIKIQLTPEEIRGRLDRLEAMKDRAFERFAREYNTICRQQAGIERLTRPVELGGGEPFELIIPNIRKKK